MTLKLLHSRAGGGKIRNTATSIDFIGVSALFDPQHACPLLRFQTHRNPLFYRHCCGVADFSGVIREMALIGEQLTGWSRLIGLSSQRTSGATAKDSLNLGRMPPGSRPCAGRDAFGVESLGNVHE